MSYSNLDISGDWSEWGDSYTDKHGFKRKAAPKPKKVIVPDGCRETYTPKHQRCDYYHYSNPNSQEALICQTPDFPAYFDPKTQDYQMAYSDRLQQWDWKAYKSLCDEYGGEQAWAYKLPGLSVKELLVFGQKALKLKQLPDAVRIVHHFNVSNGYSCPTVEAILGVSSK